MANKKPRTFAAVGREIREKWVKMYYGARPYVDALCQIDSSDPGATYITETARSVVLGFLSNCSQFRGEDARRLKAELKSMIGAK